MRGGSLVLFALLVGCVTPAPANMLVPALVDASDPVAFDAPVQAIPRCGLDFQANCHEPSIVVLPDATVLAANSFASAMARSADGGASFTLLPPVLGPAATGGGDALIELAPDGSVWWSTLQATGLVVARSTDGGLTWSTPVRVDMGGPTDRQWLALAKDGTMLATVQGKGGIRAAVSRDGGATWGRATLLTSATAIGGAPAAVGSELVVPRFDYVNGSLVVDISGDQGASWATHLVYANGSGGPGDFFPVATADGHDIVLAWRSMSRAVLLARSSDGGLTWSAPVRASRAGERVASSPWLAGEGDRLTLAYFAADQDAGPASLHVVRIVNGTAARGVAAEGIMTTLRKDRPGNTDFANFALDASGRAFAVFAASDGSIQVAREKR